MTQTIKSENQWRSQSGHYDDYFHEYDENFFYDDFKLELPENGFEDQLMDEFAGFSEFEQFEENVTNEEQNAPIVLTKVADNSYQQVQYQNQLQAFYAQQIALNLAAQNYYRSPYVKRFITDTDIPAEVYAKLELKSNEPIIELELAERKIQNAVVRPKKRMKQTVDLPDPVNFTHLLQYKDALNSLDSISFENYITQLKEVYRFTPSEKEEIKGIRGRIKNREAARKSRMKKKNKPVILEERVRQLLQETKQLETQMVELQQERTDMYNEMSFMRDTISAFLGNKDFADQYRTFYESLDLGTMQQ